MKNTEITEALHWRFAIKTFDLSKKVSDEDLKTILDAGRLAPSSMGIEPWKFIVVENVELRQKMRGEAGQAKITDASHVVVVARRTDKQNIASELVVRTAKAQGKTEADLVGLRDAVQSSIDKKTDNEADEWFRRQCYIALGIMVETAALLGVDAGPMEGFDPAHIDEVLGLAEKNLKSTTLIAFGYRGDDKYSKLPKVRREYDGVVEFIK